MRTRTRDMQEKIFPITEADWRAQRHEEDPADRRKPADLERTLETYDASSGHAIEIDESSELSSLYV